MFSKDFKTSPLTYPTITAILSFEHKVTCAGVVTSPRATCSQSQDTWPRLGAAHWGTAGLVDREPAAAAAVWRVTIKWHLINRCCFWCGGDWRLNIHGECENKQVVCSHLHQGEERRREARVFSDYPQLFLPLLKLSSVLPQLSEQPHLNSKLVERSLKTDFVVLHALGAVGVWEP